MSNYSVQCTDAFNDVRQVHVSSTQHLKGKKHKTKFEFRTLIVTPFAGRTQTGMSLNLQSIYGKTDLIEKLKYLKRLVLLRYSRPTRSVALGPLHGGSVVLLLGADGPRLEGGG